MDDLLELNNHTHEIKPDFTKKSDLKRLLFISKHLAKNIPPHGKILDVGCGNGLISKYLGQLGFEVHGIDVSSKAIKKANNENNLPNVKFSNISAENLQHFNEQYDAIICSEVLEHLVKPEKLLLELHSLLKPNAPLLVTVPNGFGPREILVTKPVQFLNKKGSIAWKILAIIKSLLGYKGVTTQSDADDLKHIQFFSKNSLIELVENSGYNMLAFGKGEFIMDVFPFSLIFRDSNMLQKLDCKIADKLPDSFTSSYFFIWEKKS